MVRNSLRIIALVAGVSLGAPESREPIGLFRRQESPQESMRVAFGGLVPDGACTLTDLDAPSGARRLAGRQLMEEGITVSIKDRPGSAVVTYRKEPR